MLLSLSSWRQDGWRVATGLALALLMSAGGAAQAQEYVVDSTQSTDVSAGKYQTLEELRLQIGTGVTWVNSDKLTIKGDDSSLSDKLNFSTAAVTIQGNGVLEAGSASNIQFAAFEGAITLVADTGKTLSIKGFNNTTLTQSGTLYGDGSSSLTLGAAGSTGTLRFESNKAKQGGALNVLGTVTFEDGIFEFSDNSVVDGFGGAVYAGNALMFKNGTYTFEKNQNESTINDGHGGAIYAASSLTFKNGTYTFSENVSGKSGSGSGGAIYAADSLTFENGMYTFSKNVGGADSAGGTGGAIRADSTLTFTDGTYNFTDNKARGPGGAVYAGSGLTFTNGDYNFTGNEAGDNSGGGGAVYASSALTFTDGTYAFTNNTANNAGGAIYGGSALTFTDGTYTFTGNTAKSATLGGGAIISGGALTFMDGTYTFTGNTATGTSGGGGAVYASLGLTFTDGTYTFTGNTAVKQGGAIYASQSATLVANSGDIRFQGNTQGTAANAANAVYLANTGNSSSFYLAAKAGRNILFSDPVESNATRSSLTIAINDPATPGGSGSYTGDVIFDGAYWIAQGKDPATSADRDAFFTSKVYGDTTVHAGTLALRNSVVYGGSNTVGTFTLGNTTTPTVRATLAADAANNVLRANTIQLNSNAAFAFDIANAVDTSKADATTNLTLDANGGVTFDAAGAHFAVTNAGAINGEVNLLFIPGYGDLTGTVAAGSTINGVIPGSLAPSPNARYGTPRFDTTVSDYVRLVTAGADDSRIATWTGAASANWKLTDANWLLTGSAEKVFKAGDHAVFTKNAAQFDVSLADSMLVSGMDVDGGAYTFTAAPGANITGDPLSLEGTQFSPTGRLMVRGTGTSARFLTDLDFANGLTVDTGATMALGAANTFVSPNGAVTLRDGSTFVFETELADASPSSTLSAGRVEADAIYIGKATLSANVDVNDYFTGNNLSSLVMHANTSLTVDTGAMLSGNTLFYQYEFLQNANDLTLRIHPKASSSPFGDLASGSNAQGLAAALDSLLGTGVTYTGTLKSALTDLINAPSSAEAAARMRELSPSVLAGGTTLSLQAARGVQRGLDSFWRYARDANETSSSFAASGAASGDGWASLRSESPATWQFWGDGSSAWSKYDSPSSDPGYEAKEWAATVVGYRSLGQSRAWHVGAAFNANHTRLDWEHNLGRTTGESVSGALLALFDTGRWFVTADAVWGTTKVESHRRLPLAGLTAKADYRTQWYGSDVAAGYRWRTGAWTLTPSAGARFYRLNTPSVSEENAGTAGLVMARDHMTSFEVFGRVDVSRTWCLANGTELRPNAYAGVSVETADRYSAPSTNFVGAPSGMPWFNGRSPETGRVAGVVGFGLDVKLSDRWVVYGGYQGEFSDRTQRHGGRIGVGVSF